MEMKPGRKMRRIALPELSGPKEKKDTGPYPRFFEQGEHARHTLQVAAQRVDVDLNGEPRHYYLASFSAYHSIVLLSISRIPVFGFQPSFISIFLTEGRRFCMSS